MAENLESGNNTGAVTIGVVKETAPGETRVALIPDSVKHLVGKGLKVVIESGAGEGSSIADDEYREQGATVAESASAVYADADVVLRVQAPSGERGELEHLKQDQVLVSFLAPLVNHDLNRQLAESGVTAMAVDAVPRITRAQSMDALSAMSTISGYKAAVLAADYLPKFFPLLMTAAGTIRPAKVLVLGAGVAGLQAIATARRLGAVVEAYDVRAVVKEQVESLGAKFVEIDTGADAEAAGGYAREATPEELKKQQEGLNDHIANADVVITTALVPGRPAPKMIPESAVERMRTGSVIVDLAAETGGNCELTTPGEITTEHGVTIIGLLNLPATLPVHGSQMYGKVMTNFLDLLVKDGRIDLNFDDEIIASMCITHQGDIVQAQTRKMMGLEEAAAPVSDEATTSPDSTSVAGDDTVGADASDELSAVDTDKLSELEDELSDDYSDSDSVVAQDDEVESDLNQEEITYGAISGDSYGSTSELVDESSETMEDGDVVAGDDADVRVDVGAYSGADSAREDDATDSVSLSDSAEGISQTDHSFSNSTVESDSWADRIKAASDQRMATEAGVDDTEEAQEQVSFTDSAEGLEHAEHDDAGTVAKSDSWASTLEQQAHYEQDSSPTSSEKGSASEFDSWESSSDEVGSLSSVNNDGGETSTSDVQHDIDSFADSSVFGDESDAEDASIADPDPMAGDDSSGESGLQHEFDATHEAETSFGVESEAESVSSPRSSKLPSTGEGTDWVAGDGTSDVPAGFPLKGNANSMIYHPEASSSYNETIAEIYFANDEAAVAHGYRLPKSLQHAAESTGSSDADTVSEFASNLEENEGADHSSHSHERSKKLPTYGEGQDWVAGDGTQNVPDGFPLKGNANSMIYHPRESHSYEQTIAEIYFASDEAAVAHGYRLPKALQHAAEEAGESAQSAVSDAVEEMRNRSNQVNEENSENE